MTRLRLQKSAPGVVEAADRFGGFSSNGAQIEQNSYLLDGADVNDSAIQTEGLIVNPDAIGELAIVSSTINPEYSRNSGAILNQTLKAGTNSVPWRWFLVLSGYLLEHERLFCVARTKAANSSEHLWRDAGWADCQEQVVLLSCIPGHNERFGNNSEYPGV